MITRYKTIKASSQGYYKEKGSKFLAFALPVNSIAGVETELGRLRKKYHDARHHCYAYILGEEGQEMRANDDGEPNHSAGDPILGQLKSLNLTNTLIVVVRYFGGTKLGVSGLINAYKTAARNALDQATVVTCTITQAVTFTFPYPATNEVMKLVHEFQISVDHQEFEEICRLEGKVAIDKADLLQKKVALLQQTGNDLELVMQPTNQ